MLKRMLSFLLSIAMVLTMLPAQALAAEVSAEETTAPTETAVETAAAETTAEPETAAPTTEPAAETTEETTLPEETVAPAEETLSASAEAAGEDTGSSGAVGDITWSYADGTLNIAGGTIPDFERYGAPWYAYALTMTNIVIEEGVTAIGDYAFADLTAVSTLTMASTVVSIGDYAFYNCDSVSEFALPIGLTAIGSYSFAGCLSLGSVTLPEGVDSIPAHAFNYCENLKFVIIPSTVASIEERAFNNCMALTSVTIPSAVTAIGSYAFCNCTALTEVVFEGSAPAIESNAFYSVTASVTIPGGNGTWENAQLDYGGSLTWGTDGAAGGVTGGVSGNVRWNLESGVMTLSGSGDMENYTYGTSPWFGRSSSIKKLVVEEGVTSIGDYAFYGCENLTEVTLPDGLKTIGARAFVYCYALNTITFAGGAPDSIDSGAFNSVAAVVWYPGDDSSWTEDIMKNYAGTLTWLAKSDSVSTGGSIGDGLSWTLDSAGTLVISGSGAVAEYANNVFDDIKTDITTIILKEGVTGIGAEAFRAFTNLAKLTLPSTMKNIDTFAFFDCAALSLVIMPNNIETLGDRCFGSCSKLSSIVFKGDAPTEIHSTAFNLITATVWYPENNDTWIGVPASYGGKLTWLCGSPYGEEYYTAQGSFGEGMAWRLADTGVLTLSGFGEMKAFGSVGFAPWYSYRDGITELVVQRGITSISYNAFYGMTSLKKVTLADTVTTIGHDAFHNCSLLEEIDFGNGLTTIEYQVFWNCTSLVSVNLPSSLTSMAQNVFLGCTALKSAVIPGSLTTLSSSTFSGCTSLETVTLGEGITTIYGSAFDECSSLTSITLPDSLVTLDNSVFSRCTSLTTVHFGSNLEIIGSSAFRECTSLQNVDLPDSLTTLEAQAFGYCDSFTAVHIPRGVTSIDSTAFFECENVTAITVDANNTAYSASNNILFSKDMTALYWYPVTKTASTYTAPSTVTVIGDHAFRKCDNLVSVTLPKGVTQIGAQAFYDCGNLASVDVGDSVVSIGTSAFYQCSSLTSIYLPDAMTTLGNSAFYDCESLSEVRLSENLTAIPAYAFRTCDSLKYIDIPDSVTSIGNHAFWMCQSLRYIDVPDAVTSIGDEAFHFCDELKVVTLGSGLTDIGASAFYGCGDLSTITIPAGVTSILGSAFAFCSNLESVVFEGDAPATFPITVFNSYVTATVYYPAGNDTWTSLNLDNFNGNLTWVAYDTADGVGMTQLETQIQEAAASSIGSVRVIQDYPVVLTRDLVIPDNVILESRSTLIVPDGVTLTLGYYAVTGYMVIESGGTLVIPETVTFNNRTYSSSLHADWLCVEEGGTIVSPDARVMVDYDDLEQVRGAAANLIKLTATTSTAEKMHAVLDAAEDYGYVQLTASGTVALDRHTDIPANTYMYFSGDMTVYSGVWLTVNGTLIFKSGSGTLTLDTGSAVVNNGQLNINEALNVGNATVLQNYGTFNANADVTTTPGSTLHNDGLINVYANFHIQRGTTYTGKGRIARYSGGTFLDESLAPITEDTLKVLIASGETDILLDDRAGIYSNYTLPAGVTLTVPSGVSLTIPKDTTFTVEGTLVVQPGGSLVVESGATIVNYNLVSVEGGTLKIEGAASGTGIYSILYGSTVSVTDTTILDVYGSISTEKELYYAMWHYGECNSLTITVTDSITLTDYSVSIPEYAYVELAEGVTLTVSSGRGLYINGYLYVPAGCALVVEEEAYVDYWGTLEVAGTYTNNGYDYGNANCLLYSRSVTTMEELENAISIGANKIYICFDAVLESHCTIPRATTWVLDGGSLTVAGDAALTISYRGTLENSGNGETLTIAEGAYLVNEGSLLLDNATLVLEGEYSGAGSFETVDSQIIGVAIQTSITEVTLFPGESANISAAVVPLNITGAALEWEADSDFVKLSVKNDTATVTAQTVTEKQTVTITVRTDNGTAAEAVVTVTILPKAELVTISRDSEDVTGQTLTFDLNAGEVQAQLTAAVLPEDASQSVTWATSNEKVAEVTDGIVTVKPVAGTAKITASAGDGSKKSATVTIQVIDVPVGVKEETVAVDGADFTLLAGKSRELKVYDQDTGKALTNKQITWSLTAYDEDGNAIDAAPFASITDKGKLTAQKVLTKVRVIAAGTIIGSAAEPVEYIVDISPAVSTVELTRDGETVSGTLYVDCSANMVTLNANVYPLDAMEGVTWTIGDKKGTYASYAEEGNTLTITPDPNAKSGTVTIKVTSDDGSKKSATVKVQFGAYAKTLTIDNKDTFKKMTVGDKAVTLTATVTPDAVTKSGVVWSLKNTADKSYVNLSAAGKVSPKAVLAPVDVTIVATSKDGMASDEHTITIYPKNGGQLVIKSGETYVTKTTQTLDANKRESITLAAYTYNGTELEIVDWTPKTAKNAVITEVDGRLTIQILDTASVSVTAKAADGRKATVTVKGVKLAESILISQKKTGITEGLEVASGKSLDLQTTMTGTTGKKVVWSIVEGEEYAAISSSGKLTAVKDLTSAHKVVVKAAPADGGDAEDTIEIMVRPIAQGVQVYTVENGVQTFSAESSGSWWVRSNTTLEWNLTEPGEIIRLKAKVYPFYSETGPDRNAIQDVTWKSSSTKVADFVRDEEGNVQLKVYKTGSTTITVTADDGSKQKVSFKLNVVKKVSTLTLESQEVPGGKSLNLVSFLTIDPGDATNKKLTWEITGGEAYAAISASGVLKAKKVTAAKTVEVTVTAQDGSGVSDTCIVTITP